MCFGLIKPYQDGDKINRLGRILEQSEETLWDGKECLDL
jgi:hypothetical protein